MIVRLHRAALMRRILYTCAAAVYRQRLAQKADASRGNRIVFKYRRDNPWHYVGVKFIMRDPSKPGRAHARSRDERSLSPGLRFLIGTSTPSRASCPAGQNVDAANFALPNPCLGGSWGPFHALGSPPALSPLFCCSPHLVHLLGSSGLLLLPS